MKIVHLSLCGPVTDYLTYQDNLLPKYHKEDGHEVVMITSKFIYNTNGELIRDTKDIYYNEYDIKTIRLDIKKNKNVNSKFKRYDGLLEALVKEKPETLFIHGIQFLDVKLVVKYLQTYPQTTVYVDNHADFSNSATNWISKNVLHKIIWKYQARIIYPYVTKFYGVLPSRVEFLNEMYDINREKLDLLLMGANTQLVLELKSKYTEIYNELSVKYEFNDEFVIITGGKIDSAKLETLTLMEVVGEYADDIKLIIFGSIDPHLKNEFEERLRYKNIEYVGWLNEEDIYKHLMISDLGIFPGRHSVLWEQAVGIGLPCVFKYWSGSTHINPHENAVFLKNGTKKEIEQVIVELKNNDQKYNILKKNALKAAKVFSYEDIAKKSIKG